MPELAGFTYRYDETSGGGRTLLLLHGTGADENDLVPLGRALDPQANLLSPRGRVLENGMPRFFRRFAEGVLDVDDLKQRTKDLAGFIAAAAAEHGFDPANVIAVGFSNGANIASSTLLLYPDTLKAAILFRAMFPFEPEEPPALQGKPIFMANGRQDPLIHPQDAQRLATLFDSAGAAVTLSWSPGGHGLERGDLDAAASWLSSVS